MLTNTQEHVALDWITLGSVTLPLLYLGLTALYVTIFLKDTPWANRIAGPAVLGTVAAHVATLTAMGMTLGRVPMATSAEFFSLLVLVLVLLYFVIEQVQDVRETGFVIMAMAFLLQLISSAFLNPAETGSPMLRDPGFAVHMLLVLFAYTALSLAFVYALLYLVQARQLAQKQFGLLFRRLPSLSVLERMTLRSIQIGVPLLFVALLAGQLWLWSLMQRLDPATAANYSLFDPKILSAWATFVVYSLGLVGHRYAGWRGRRISLFVVSAFVLMILSTAVVRVTVTDSFHRFNTELGL